MVFAKAADGGGGDDHPCNVALMRELMLKEDDALMVVKPPHKVVPPYDNDEQQEETQRRSISKRIKRAMVAFARGPSSRRQSPLCQSSSLTSPSAFTTSTDASDAIMELFSIHDPRNRGKLSWDTFIDIVDTSFHLNLTSTERRLFRVHLHVPDGGTVSYVKFIAHVFDAHHHHAPSKSPSKIQLIQDNDQGSLPPHPDHGMPSSPSHLPLLHSSSSADLTDAAAAKRKQQGDLHCTKQFLQKLVKQACVEATLWHASIPQVLRRAMLNEPLDEDSTATADDAPLFLDTTSCTLDQAQFFMAMYVSLNVKVAADADADRIFHQLVPASKDGPSTVTLHDLLDALVRCGLLKPPAATPAAASSTMAPSMLPRLGPGGG